MQFEKNVGVHLLYDNARSHVASENRRTWMASSCPLTILSEHRTIQLSFVPAKHYLRGKSSTSTTTSWQSRGIFALQSPEFLVKDINDMPFRWAKVIDLSGDYVVEKPKKSEEEQKKQVYAVIAVIFRQKVLLKRGTLQQIHKLLPHLTKKRKRVAIEPVMDLPLDKQ
ncbi:hypothetical protein OESDEN_09500 [Oesophagostomum dentatum]|uniref:Uncharacterized protein n=1 Tax=Oesophagostomum dentatum TaxID=61180 RepID=A0A0B1SZH6_OESDE|nr:hypothetical protein OESDEN_09500 [Oesophagostomum dentatum]